MVGEHFKIYSSQLGKNTLKLSTMVGENFDIYSSQLAKNAFKLSTMVGEKIGIYSSQLVKNTLKILKLPHRNWLKIHLNRPTWLEKILEFIHLN